MNITAAMIVRAMTAVASVCAYVPLYLCELFIFKIVGDKWDVKCLLSNGANPESYDPSLTHLLNLENSKAYFRMSSV